MTEQDDQQNLESIPLQTHPELLLNMENPLPMSILKFKIRLVEERIAINEKKSQKLDLDNLDELVNS